jgi:hypothetical protein
MLTLVGPENLEAGLQLNQAQEVAASAQESLVMRECGYTTDSRQHERSLLLTTLSMLSRTGVRLILDRLERRVQQELEKYSAVYQAETEGLLYRFSDSSGRPLLRFNCLRIARLPAGKDDAPAELDLVLRLKLSAQGDAMELTPLRLYLAKPAAATSDGRVDISVNLAANAIWRDQTIGRGQTIFDQVVFSTSAPSGGSVAALRYFATDTVRPVLLPIIPVSTSVDPVTPYGYARITATVAETGVPPDKLEQAVDLLSRHRDSISAALLKACENRLLALATH